jgi:hypothetical protein
LHEALFLVESEHCHICANGANPILLWVKEVIVRQWFIHARVEVDEVGMGSSLGAVSGEVSNFPTLEASIVGVRWLAIARDISAISLSLPLESYTLESSPLLTPRRCSSPA